jgi:putative protease
MGVESLILSPELTLPQARDIGGAVITYGRIPLMITERCFIRDSAGCSACGKFSLTDRLGERFPIMREWQHRNLILNSRVTYMGDKSRELKSLGLSSHLIFTTESASEIRDVKGRISRGEPLSTPDIRRVGKRGGKGPIKKGKRK